MYTYDTTDYRYCIRRNRPYTCQSLTGLLIHLSTTRECWILDCMRAQSCASGSLIRGWAQVAQSLKRKGEHRSRNTLRGICDHTQQPASECWASYCSCNTSVVCTEAFASPRNSKSLLLSPAVKAPKYFNSDGDCPMSTDAGLQTKLFVSSDEIRPS